MKASSQTKPVGGKLIAVELKSKLEMVQEAIARLQKRIEAGEPITSILILTESDDPTDRHCSYLKQEQSADLTVKDNLWFLEKARLRLMRETEA